MILLYSFIIGLEKAIPVKIIRQNKHVHKFWYLSKPGSI